MAELNLFCYGTLISSVVREKVLGDQQRLLVQKAYLHGFTVMKVARTNYPVLIKAAEGQIALGTLLSGLTNIELSILDRFEGVNYSRETRVVLAEDGSRVNSFVYLPNKFLETAGKWNFEDWESVGLTLFLSHDFNLAGIRSPEARAT